MVAYANVNIWPRYYYQVENDLEYILWKGFVKIRDVPEDRRKKILEAMKKERKETRIRRIFKFVESTNEKEIEEFINTLVYLVSRKRYDPQDENDINEIMKNVEKNLSDKWINRIKTINMIISENFNEEDLYYLYLKIMEKYLFLVHQIRLFVMKDLQKLPKNNHEDTLNSALELYAISTITYALLKMLKEDIKRFQIIDNPTEEDIEKMAETNFIVMYFLLRIMAFKKGKITLDDLEYDTTLISEITKKHANLEEKYKSTLDEIIDEMFGVS